MSPVVYATEHDRLFSRVAKTETCWLWTGGQDGKGYGNIGMSKGLPKPRHVRAHVFAYELLVGPIPKGMHLHHVCGNPLCVRPEHLRLVTASEHTHLHKGERQHGTDSSYGGGCRCEPCRAAAAAARRRRRLTTPSAPRLWTPERAEQQRQRRAQKRAAALQQPDV